MNTKKMLTIAAGIACVLIFIVVLYSGATSEQQIKPTGLIPQVHKDPFKTTKANYNQESNEEFESHFGETTEKHLEEEYNPYKQKPQEEDPNEIEENIFPASEPFNEGPDEVPPEDDEPYWDDEEINWMANDPTTPYKE